MGNIKRTERFYTVKTLAERLAVTPMTIYRLVKQGKLSAVKIGRAVRFDPEAVDAFLRSASVGPGGMSKRRKKRKGCGRRIPKKR